MSRLNAEPQTSDGALQPARERLSAAISALIDPQRVTLPEGRHTWLDSTYQMLVDSCYEKHSLGGGRSQPASPLFLDATDCRYEIDDLVRHEHPMPTPALEWEHPTVLRLQKIDERTWRPQDTRHIIEFAAELERLTKKAESLLDPATLWYLPNPCPLCGKSTVYVDNSGDQVRRPALQLTVDWCRCGNVDCEGFWPNREFSFLGRLLGFQPPEGVITA